MTNLLQLSTETDDNGYVHYIANRTKKNYINLGGINSIECIHCVHQYLCNSRVWNESDIVVFTLQSQTYIPKDYHDISFVLNYYNRSRIAQEQASQVIKPTMLYHQIDYFSYIIKKLKKKLVEYSIELLL